MKEIMLIALKYIKLLELKKAIVLLLILIGNTVHAQNVAIKKPGSIHKSLPEYEINNPMLAEMELKNELYKIAPENSYKQKSKTSLIIGLSLLPPAFLFSQLAEPKYPYWKYRFGWGAAAFAAGGTMLFYIIRSAHFRNKHKRTK